MCPCWGGLGMEPSPPTHRGSMGKTPTHISHQLLWGSALGSQAGPGKKSIQQLMIPPSSQQLQESAQTWQDPQNINFQPPKHSGERSSLNTSLNRGRVT